jgi:hypothetical protein
MRSAVKIAIGISLCVIPFLAGAQSPGAEIRIDPGNCSSGVQLIARNAPLSDVLQRLAQSLDFQLQLEGSTDSVVNMNAAMPAPELVAKLSTTDNIIVTQSRDPRCPARYRIVKVWVLPKAKGMNVARAAVQVETSQQQPRRLEEMSRQAKEAYETYVRIHGKPPPGEPEEVTKPQ